MKNFISACLCVCVCVSCSNETLTENVKNPEIEALKNWQLKNLSESSNSLFNSSNLIIHWDEAFAEQDKVDIAQVAKVQSDNNVSQTKLSLDKWGYPEFITKTKDCSVVKVPVSFRLKNGYVLSERLFLYIVKNKDGNHSNVLVSYSKNKSWIAGTYTGKMLITTPDNSTSVSAAIYVTENQIVDINAVSGKNSGSTKQYIARASKEEFLNGDIVAITDRPAGLVFNEAMDICDWSGGDCNSFYTTSSGQHISACTAESSGYLGPNSTGITGVFPIAFKLYLSTKALNNVAIGLGFAAVIGSYIPEPIVSKIIAVGLALNGAEAALWANNCGNGAVFTYIGIPLVPPQIVRVGAECQ